ncbi:MAG: RrF2 family transcriptional regulator [Pseudanabaena sp.]|uniref:RrF2 family transcriptional regulator n=1 Tax=Pseudanabaena mucicola TaxID=71190 RepID=UPI002574BDB3|nr:Rrf2 family transcriptional regulator [Pseudanabaena mucicola]MCA6571846.1 Rrf2 family transcriptional regulator [Pseudanabaena sp. M53BS1SP1A06MG]MCA6581034.1 Rrf2 family transcriptional regulator [Pseudanabaena sp. M34BS1SP1A06MG]MCA6584925.1 Rrf2 family transcriptional regulator [Pseudanabaena sp. M051S1SP1A06QC]MCA6588249.1 Rrf2 family transcriptional regulator [Pseudanabaena sp. M109S1SP1A06QC]MCA6593966.1 Rrf2 family transcriptional regulator [Pseudanabaena sp. M38BS1SP1A06MG]MCA6596
MELSLKSEYAILAMLELANHFAIDQPLQIRQIANLQNIPDRYLEQLLATLKRQGLVKSQRGSKGGYILAREPWEISLLQIIQGIEGYEPITENNNKLGQESASLSVIREAWEAAQKAASHVLDSCTLKDLCDRQRQRQIATTMYYI